MKLIAALAVVLTVAPLALAQDPKPVPPPVPIPGNTPAPTFRDVDGNLPKAGELPASTSKVARERWTKATIASLVPGVERKPVTAFDLSIDLQYRKDDRSTNNAPNARYRWLAPGYVRAETGRSKVAHLRGPQGSFLLDWSKGDKVESIRLDVGRENTTDLRQLDEEASIAGNFAALTNPGSVRVLKLVEVAAPASVLPDVLIESAKVLAWIEIESPDFFFPGAQPNVARIARVTLGLDPESSLPQIVVVDDASKPKAINLSTVVLQLSDFRATDGFQVPFKILIFMPEAPDPKGPPSAPWMRKTPAMDMVVTKASLRAPLKPEDFTPSAQLPK